jgi:hypothetical protein
MPLRRCAKKGLYLRLTINLLWWWVKWIPVELQLIEFCLFSMTSRSCQAEEITTWTSGTLRRTSRHGVTYYKTWLFRNTTNDSFKSLTTWSFTDFWVFFVSTLSIAKTVYSVWRLNERVWSIGEMTLKGGNRNSRVNKTCPSETFFTLEWTECRLCH